MPRRKDGDAAKHPADEQLLITRHKDGRRSRDGRAQYGKVIFVSNRSARHGDRFHDFTVCPQPGNGCIDLSLGCLELSSLVLRDLAQDVRGENDHMVTKDERHQGLTQTVRGDGRQYHVRVEHHPHETALKMSSSVMNPCDSARGTIIFRRAASCSLALERRKDSRTSSLAGRCCRRLKASSCRFSAAGILRVSVVFMERKWHPGQGRRSPTGGSQPLCALA